MAMYTGDETIPNKLPVASDFHSVEQLDALIKDIEQQLIDCDEPIGKIQAAIEDTIKRYSVRAKAGRYQYRLQRYRNHHEMIMQCDEKNQEITEKLARHNAAIKLVPEWNQWMHANNRPMIQITRRELYQLKCSVDNELASHKQYHQAIIQDIDISSQCAQLTHNIELLSEESRLLFSERIALQSSQSKSAIDRKILINRDKITQLELQHQQLLEQFERQPSRGSDSLERSTATQEYDILLRKRELIQQQSRRSPLPPRTPERAISIQSAAVLEQAYADWQRVFNLSKFTDEDDFLKALLTPNQVADLTLFRDRYTEKVIKAQEKIWIMEQLVDLEQLLHQHQQRLFYLSQYYVALERIEYQQLKSAKIIK